MPADLKMFGRFAFAGFIVGCFTQTCGEAIDLGLRGASHPNRTICFSLEGVVTRVRARTFE